MKNEERLRESYEIQKKIFDEAENRRIKNVQKQKLEIESKIASLQQKIEDLEKRINNRREFESFDSFRTKTETLSSQSKSEERIS